jgi:sn-1 stearoyl-lipid 9-desaturase
LTEFLLALIGFYIWHGVGVTIGYHRLLSHRSFTCGKLVEYFFVLAGYLAFEGSPIWWAAIHRAHHRYVDTPLDPHSPRYGYTHSYFGWLFELDYPSHIVPATQCKDLVQDPIYQFLEQGGDLRRMNAVCFWINMGFRLVLLVAFGWKIALASILAGVLVLQIPLVLNLVCHIPKLGYRTFATKDDSVNVWWVGLLAFGEGWHNNHHAYPGSARNGMKIHEIDFSFFTIRALKLCGLVSWLNPGPDLSDLAHLEPFAEPELPPAADSGDTPANKMTESANPTHERLEELELSGRR